MAKTSDQPTSHGKSVAETQAKWSRYATPEGTPTYGTYHNRMPEYRVLAIELRHLGLSDDDLIVDIGAGSCDLDHYLRTKAAWRGKYLPVDGAVQGIDLEGWIPDLPADYYVSVEFVEHLHEPWPLVEAMIPLARKGIVITTPNPSVCDVLSLDSTHYSSLWREEFETLGFDVHDVDLNRRGTAMECDTLVAVMDRRPA